jgi:hypothetical protein
MKTGLANQKLDAIIANVEKGGVTASNLVEDLKALREMALLEQDPLVVKLLRLTYEFLTENESFDVQAQYDEDEEGNEYPMEIEENENLLYLLNLLKNADHKINREEMKDYRTALKAELY